MQEVKDSKVSDKNITWNQLTTVIGIQPKETLSLHSQEGRESQIIQEDPISDPDVYLADTNHIVPEEPCPGQENKKKKTTKKKTYLDVVWIQRSIGSSLKSKPDSRIHWRKHQLLPEKPRRDGSAAAQSFPRGSSGEAPTCQCRRCETQFQSLGQEDPLEEEMTTHFSILAWRIPWTEEPGGLQSMGSQRVGHDWATELNWTELNLIDLYNSDECISLYVKYNSIGIIKK